MDAGIIAAFKRRYRRFHLQNSLDRDERNEANIYKVDQLTAMRWSLAAWNEISSSTIQNCFRHTGLMDIVLSEGQKDVSSEISVGLSEEQLVEQQLEAAVKQLPLNNPIPIKYLVDPNEEMNSAHIEMTDAEIIELVQELQETEECPSTDEEVENISTADKLNSLSITISLLDLSCEDHLITHRVLRQIQSVIRTTKTTQPILNSRLEQMNEI